MEIPASFQTAIASKFYTDTITPMAQVEKLDAEGGAQRVATTAGEPVPANAQPIDAELRKALIGDTTEAEYKITTPPNVPVEKGALIEYAGEIHKVVDFKKYDSHAELLTRRWTLP